MTTPEPKDKLGATTASIGGDAFAVPVNAAVVNGPEDDLRDWSSRTYGV